MLLHHPYINRTVLFFVFQREWKPVIRILWNQRPVHNKHTTLFDKTVKKSFVCLDSTGYFRILPVCKSSRDDQNAGFWKKTHAKCAGRHTLV